MIVLAVDTCFDACSVAVFDDGAGKLIARFEPMVTGHAEHLVPMVSQVMEEAGLEFEQLDAVAITNGPGTFTGTRIGVASARSLALALDKPLLTASSLAVIAAQAHGEVSHNDNSADVLIAMDARRGEVYFQSFAGGDPLSAPMVGTPQQAIDTWAAATLNPKAALIVAGTAAGTIAAALDEAGRDYELSLARLPNATYLASLAPTLSSQGPTSAPLYLRPADAKPQTGKSIERTT